MGNAIAKAKLDGWNDATIAFYTDFMPMIQQIKNNMESIKINEQNADILNNINEKLAKAESLLRQLKNFSDVKLGANATKIALKAIKGGTVKHHPKSEGQYLVKVDKDYIYVLSETEGKIDLLDNNWNKVKEIAIEELEE